jgi:HK97 family phage major capsid protein
VKKTVVLEEEKDLGEPGRAAVIDGKRCLVLSAVMGRAQAGNFKVLEPVEGEPMRVRVRVSSETPARQSFGMEVLGHGPGEINLSRFEGSPVLYSDSAATDHKGRRVGKVESVEHDVTTRELWATIRMSRGARAQEVVQEIQDEILTDVSPGYMPGKPRMLGKSADGVKSYYFTGWTPAELTIVNGPPADPRASIMRSVGGDGAVAVEVEGDEPIPGAKEERKMKKVKGEGNAILEVADDDSRLALTDGDIQTLQRNAMGLEVAEIVKVCRDNSCLEELDGFIKRGLSVRDVKAEILDKRTTARPKSQPAGETIDAALAGLPDEMLDGYSFGRALSQSVQVREGSKNKIDGLEGEINEHIRTRALGNSWQDHGGVYMPMRSTDDMSPERRKQFRMLNRAVTMGPNTALGGAELIPNQLGEMIDLLRNETMCMRLGARSLTGLTGTITWPRVTGDPTVRWMGTNPATPAADSGSTFGWVNGTAKTMIGTVPMPRQLLQLANMDVEGFVRRILALGHSLALDLAGLSGKGTDSEPLGIFKNPDIQTQAIGGIPSQVLLRKMQGLVGAKNGLGGGSPGYITTPQMAALLAGTQVASNMPSFIWQGALDDGQLAGYRAVSTNQCTISTNDHQLMFGAWYWMIFLLWGALEAVVDPYSLATYGQVRITTFQMGDVVCQRPECFVSGTGATLGS